MQRGYGRRLLRAAVILSGRAALLYLAVSAIATLLLSKPHRNFDFAPLGEAPGKEIVLGLTGRFWALSGCLEETGVETFRSDQRAGLARAAWTFLLEPVGDKTRVVTETRVRYNDRASRRRFAAYWLVVQLFSGLLRRFMLKELRLEAERNRAA